MRIVFNGIRAATGEYLDAPMSVQELVARITGAPAPEVCRAAPRASEHLGPTARIAHALDDLAVTGWGVVFGPGMEAERAALAPLLEHRQARAAALQSFYYRDLTFQPGESGAQFLARHFAEVYGPADPKKMPYYLLLVGSPAAIPFTVQYDLAGIHAVGRVHFDDLDGYARYAESVVAAETGGPSARRAAFWGTAHPGDPATEGAARYLLTPVAETFRDEQPDWEVGLAVGALATKQRLLDLLAPGVAPGLLFTASHGVGVDADDPRLPERNGALLCQDYGVFEPQRRAVTDEDCFGAADLPDGADVSGLIAFHFACFGGGTPRVDSLERARQLAANSFVAALPKRLLSHPRGSALAVVAHVGRAFGCAFFDEAAGPQNSAFDSLLFDLARGQPVGAAMEHFAGRYGATAVRLSDLLGRRLREEVVDENELVSAWTASTDARSYVVLGDPAVRLR